MSSVISTSQLVRGTQATRDEYKRVDKWRCHVAEECVAELEQLRLADTKAKGDRKSKASSVKDDSLVVYDPERREEIFEDFDKNGRPITVIRRYKSVKEPSIHKSERNVVQVTIEPSSSRSSESSRHGRDRRTRSKSKRAPYDDDQSHQSDHSYPTRNYHSIPVAVRSRDQPRSREAPSAMSNRKSEQLSSAKQDIVRRMLKLHDSHVVSSRREDSAHSQSKASRERPTSPRSRARSYDGRNTYVRQRSRDRASLRSGYTRPINYGPSIDAKPYYYDLRDARREQQARAETRDYDRRSTYSMPRRSKTVNRGYESSQRSYGRRSPTDVDDARIESEIDRIHRRVEQFQTQPGYMYEPRRRSRRMSLYDGYDY